MTRSKSHLGVSFVVLGGATLAAFALGVGAVHLAARSQGALESRTVAGGVSKPKPHAPLGGNPNAIPVSLLRPSSEAFEEEVDLLAAVSPRTVTSVHFLLPGKVDACGVKVGDAVEAGQVLCSLDASVVRLEKERAQAALANAERALDSTFLDRQKTLYESGVIGQGDYERVRVEAERGSSLRDDARTALALVEKKLALHVLKAPFRGRIVDVRARAGLPIGPEVPAFVVSSLDGLVLKAEVPAKHWAAVDKGTNFLLKSVASMALSSSLGGENAPRFAVVDKAPSVDLAKQTFDVELLPVGRLPSVGLAPGMLVSGALVVARYEPGLTLPLEALVAWDASTREGEVFVREPESGVVVARKVTTSGASGGRVHLLKGISDDDDVVSPVPPHLAAGDVVFDARHTHDTEGSP